MREENEAHEANCSTEYLPFHLIFACLPVHQLFQLRCVCKLWNSMLGGDALPLLLARAMEQEEYWFVISRPLPYVNDERAWDFRAFSSLEYGASFGFPLPTVFGGGLLPDSHRPRLASGGGLMCAFVHKPDELHDYHVIVFNCLTDSVKLLPPLLNPDYLSSGPGIGCNMYMSIDDDDPSRYYIVVTQLDLCVKTSDDHYFEIFDSRKGCWRVGHAMESSAMADDTKLLCGDFFFKEKQWASLMAYHAADDLWSKVKVPRELRLNWPGEGIIFSKYKGRLLQGLSRRSGNAWLGFGVWELQFDCWAAATWVEVARTPHDIWQGRSSPSCRDWVPKLMAEGSIFCMAFEDREMQGHFRPPLVYDIAQNSWYVLPCSVAYGCISVYRPRFSASP